MDNDSRHPPQPAAQIASSSAMIMALGTIALISGFLVVLVFQATKPIIEQNKREAIERSIFKVVKGAVQKREYLLSDNGITSDLSQPGTSIYAGFDSEGRLVGIAAEAAAQGYQDVVRVLFGYSPACQCITGFEVLKMTETPGLGDKIITDASFVAQFNDLDARPNSQGTGLAHPIATVKHGRKQNPWEIDAISGATITSNALGKALNNSGQIIIPAVHRELTLLNQGPLPSTEQSKEQQ